MWKKFIEILANFLMPKKDMFCEKYLSESTDLFDLERRQQEIMRGRYY